MMTWLNSMKAAALTGALMTAAPIVAAPSGISELLRQAEFWQSKGREDLSRQAYRRVLQIDPRNAQARRGLEGARAAAQVQQPVAQPVKPAARVARPEPKPAAPEPRRKAQPRRASADPGGEARAAGFRALDQGDIATAASRFQTALKVRPNDADALGGLGIARLRADRFAEARELLQRASRGGEPGKWSEALEAASFFADLRSAESARDGNRLQEAEAIARSLSQSGYPNADLAKALLGDVLSRQNRFAEAATVYSSLSANGDTSAKAANELLRTKIARERALQAAATGDPYSAERLFQSAIVSDPSDPWMRYEYARFLVAQGRTVTAITTMEPLNNAATPDGLYAAALFQNQIGRTAIAASLMERIPQDRLSPEMRSFLIDVKTSSAIDKARQLHSGGRSAEALTGLRAIASRPGLSTATMSSLAQGLYDLGDVMGAQMLTDQALQQPLGDPAAYQGLVSVLTRSGQDSAAAALVQRFGAEGRSAQQVGRLAAAVAASQADRLRLQGQHAVAFDMLQAAWAGAPNDHTILSALARLYQSGGLSGQAVRVYEILLRAQPTDVSALAGLADAAAAANDFARARAAIARAIQLSPTDADIYLAAARVEQARGDKGAAMRFLRQARALHQRRGGLGSGQAFPSANPFAPSGAPAFAQPQVPQNPFALPPLAPSPLPYGGQAPATGYPTMPSAPYGGTLSAAFGGGAQPGTLGGFPAPMQTAPQQMYGSGPAAFPYVAPAYSTQVDPELARIDQEIAALTHGTAPSLEASTGFRSRSGEVGLSKLTEVGATFKGSVPFSGGRVSLSASPVVLDAGSPTRSGLARVGTNAIPEAQGIVNQEESDLASADTQYAAGVAVSAAFESGALKADVGSTPLGFRKTNVQGSIRISPKIGKDVTVGVYGERRPVTDSIVSYAGTRDPLTQAPWGSVMRTGGGGTFSYDRDGNGIYAEGNYRRYSGENVLKNSAVEANIGGYLLAYRSASTSVTLGGNLNYQSFDNNQNHFTLGHGGYFSPQSFVSLAFPMRYSTAVGGWKVDVNASPGYQSYQQDEVDLFPTRPDLQQQLNAAKAENEDVRSTYDSLSKSGLAFSGSASAGYQLGRATRVTGEVRYNTFGIYNEFQTTLGLKQSLGGDK